MQQPYGLPLRGFLDFSFDATELLIDGDSVSDWVLTPSSNLVVSDESTASGYVTFWAQWTGSPAVGTTGSVTARITSTDGRILVKEMTFMVVASL